MMSQAQHNLRTFYVLILTQTFSLIGSRISGLAIGIWLYFETGNATPLTLVAFFGAIPMVLASSLSGVLADRIDRRLLMVFADSGQAVGTLLLLTLFMTDSFQVWHLYSITFVQSIFGVFQWPAFTASVTMLVPPEHRDRANAIQQISGPAANIIAPAIIGALYAAVGVNGAIAIDLLTFLVAMIVVFSVHIPRPQKTDVGSEEQGSMWYEAWTGLRYLRKHRPLFMLMLYIAMLNFLISAVMGLSIPYVLERTGSSAALGAIQSLSSIGAIVGAVSIGLWAGYKRTTVIITALLMSGIAVGLVGAGQSAWTIGAALLFFMLPLPVVNALFQSIMQAKTPPDIQGRVFAVLGQISMLLTPLAYLVSGPLADRVFEPAVASDMWSAVAPLVGEAPGAGMGLMFVIAGTIITGLTVVVFSRASIRDIEANMPDYIATAEPEATPQPEVTGPEAVPNL